MAQGMTKIAGILSALFVTAVLSVSPSFAAEERAVADRFVTYTKDPVSGQLSVRDYYPCDHEVQYRWPSWNIDFINNGGCSRRLWVYENIDKSGAKKCIGPGQGVFLYGGLRQPVILEVGPQRPCP